MPTHVSLTRVEPAPTAVVRKTTTWQEFPAAWGPMLDVVWAVLRSTSAGLHKPGHNVMFYKDDIPNVEVGVQVSGPFDSAGDVVPSQLPGGLAATATHTGPMNLIGDTHHAIVEWCEENGHRLDGRRWEIYGDPDPSSGEFAVQVYWSVLAE